MGLFQSAPFLPLPNPHDDEMVNTCTQHSTRAAKPPWPAHAHTQSSLVANTVGSSLKTVPIGVDWGKGPSALKCHLPFSGVHSKGHLTSRKVGKQKIHTTTVLLRVCQAAYCRSPL